jgi:uncharacterized protein
MPYGPVYVHRDVMNPRRILTHFFDQGVAPLKSDLHVTVVYSKASMDHGAVSLDSQSLLLPAAPRTLACYGPEDQEVLVLEVNHPHLHTRHGMWRDAGASSDFPDYRPHITVHKVIRSGAPYVWKAMPPSFQNIKPYTQDVLLGPEQIGPLMMPNP